LTSLEAEEKTWETTFTEHSQLKELFKEVFMEQNALRSARDVWESDAQQLLELQGCADTWEETSKENWGLKESYKKVESEPPNLQDLKATWETDAEELLRLKGEEKWDALSRKLSDLRASKEVWQSDSEELCRLKGTEENLDELSALKESWPRVRVSSGTGCKDCINGVLRLNWQWSLYLDITYDVSDLLFTDANHNYLSDQQQRTFGGSGRDHDENINYSK
jgi:hypothetical protein